MFTLNFLESPLGREPDDLVEGKGDYPYAMNPRSAKDRVVGRWVV